MSERDDSKPPEDAPAPPEKTAGGEPEGEPKEAGAEAAPPGEAPPGEALPAKAPPDEPAPEEAAPEKPAPDKPAAAEPASEAKAAEPADKPADDEAAKKAAAEEAAKKAAAAKAQREAAARAKAEAEAAKPPWERAPVPPEWEDAAEDPLAAALAEAHGEALVSARAFAGDLVLELAPSGLQAVAADLRDRGYTLLVDVCGAHYPKREEGRFEVLYHVYSLDENRRVRLKVKTDEDAAVPTVVGVWKGANWPEREVWDMYGVRFDGHPDMTRILMWEGFNGHPLRKEFPVEGIDTGSAIYPEYYEDDAGPVAGTGTGWKPAPPPEPETAAEDEAAPEEG